MPWAPIPLLLLMAGPALGDAAHDLFTGQDQAGKGGPTARFPCHNCHGRDGQGGIEGDVPDIADDALREPTDLRPAYDLAAFRQALQQGLDPTGRALSRIMPRYDMTPEQTSLLWDYLADLPRQQSLGIGAGTIRLGVMADPRQPAIAGAYIDRMRAAMAETLPALTVYGRKVELVALTDPLAEADQILALLAMPPGHEDLTARLTATGLPVIFPMAALGGAEDATVQRAFTPCAREVNLAIARQLSDQPGQRIALSADPQRADELSYFIRLEQPDAQVWLAGPDAPEAPDTVLDLDGGFGDVLPKGAALYQLASTSRNLSARPDVREHFLIDDAPALLDLVLEGTLHPLEAHADLAARILSEALLQAGRDLSRSRLLTVLEFADLGAIKLDYDSYPLCGTGEVLFRTLHQGDQ